MQRKTRDNIYTRESSAKDDTEKEHFQSMPATTTDNKFNWVTKEKAHPEYLATLSFRQILFGKHEINSENFKRR